MNRFLVIMFTVGLLAPTTHGQNIQGANQQPSIRDAVLTGWREVLTIDDPLLAHSSDAKPDFTEDAQGIRSAGVEFVTNADWNPKASRPAPIDPQRSYLWVQVSVWRHDVPGQPSSTTIGLHADGADYNLLVLVLSSDPALAARIESMLLGKFARWRTDQNNGPPNPSPLIPSKR